MKNTYKERAPSETIGIITEIFENADFKTRWTSSRGTYGTWSCIVNLYYKDLFLFSTNGKGMTEQYALASGFGELMERAFLFYTPSSNVYMSLKLKKDNVLDELPLLEEKLSAVAKRLDGYVFDKSNTKNMIMEEFLTGKQYKANRRLITYLTGSNGGACGNTYKEAFNQAFSELCEREVYKSILAGKWRNFKIISEDLITNENLKTILNNIKKDNKEIRLYDCSWENSYPVIMSVLIDKSIGIFTIDLGCFPEFDIALERCLTESNQNISHPYYSYSGKYQKPYRENTDSLFYKEGMKGTALFFLHNDEEMLTFDKTADRIGDAFLKSQTTNNEVYDYWKSFIEKNGIGLYEYKQCIQEKMWVVKLVSEFGSTFNRTNVLEKPENQADMMIAEKASVKIIESVAGEYDYAKFLQGYRMLSRINEANQEKILDYIYMGSNIFGYFAGFLTPAKINSQMDEIRTNHDTQEKPMAMFKNSIYSLIKEKGYLPSTEQILEDAIYKPLREMNESGVIEKLIRLTGE